MSIYYDHIMCDIMRIGFSSKILKRIQYNAWLLTHKQFPEVMSHVETIKEEPAAKYSSSLMKNGTHFLLGEILPCYLSGIKSFKFLLGKYNFLPYAAS